MKSSKASRVDDGTLHGQQADRFRMLHWDEHCKRMHDPKDLLFPPSLWQQVKTWYKRKSRAEKEVYIIASCGTIAFIATWLYVRCYT